VLALALLLLAIFSAAAIQLVFLARR